MHPKYHVSPPQHWINDPNGFIYYNGTYHLFYQHFPYENKWGTMHWYHVTSKDLIHWQNQGIAIYPTKDYDANGCFSGTSLEVNGKLHIYYTSVRYRQPNHQNIHIPEIHDDFFASQSMMISDDGYHFDNLNKKQKIIDVFKEGEIGHVTHTRDPKVWSYNGTYYMLLVSKYLDCHNREQGQLLFYNSPDAINWSYVNNYRKIQLGHMWECPDYFSVNNKEILLLAPEGTDQEGYPSHARIGTCHLNYDNMDFDITSPLRYLDYGKDLYAPQSTLDKDGQRVYIGWMRMEKPGQEDYIGMLTYPRVITYKNNHVYTDIHPSIKKFFSQEVDHFDHKIPCMIQVSLKEKETINIGGYIITYDHYVQVDRQAVYIKDGTALLQCQSPEIDHCDLEIFIDHHIIEIYINNGFYVISHIIYQLNDIFDCQGIIKIADE